MTCHTVPFPICACSFLPWHAAHPAQRLQANAREEVHIQLQLRKPAITCFSFLQNLLPPKPNPKRPATSLERLRCYYSSSVGQEAGTRQ